MAEDSSDKLQKLSLNGEQIQPLGKSEKKFSFGIIADVQYADLPNGRNYQQTRTRFYRNALVQLKKAVSHWNTGKDILFLVHLGDLIDGQNKKHDKSETALQAVCDEFSEFKGPVYHILGNHDLYNFTRTELLNHKTLFSHETIDLPIDNVGCFQISPMKGYQIIFLDQYSFSTLGIDSTEEMYNKALSYLQKRNRNTDLNSPEGMRGFDKRFLKFNGGVDELQLAWFDECLSRAEAKNEKVLVFGHLAVYRPSSCSMCLCWNYEQVLEVLHKYSCVVVYCCGHDHDGGAAVDEKGIQHITLEGVVESKPGTECYATVHVHDKKINFVGYGKVPDYEIKF